MRYLPVFMIIVISSLPLAACDKSNQQTLPPAQGPTKIASLDASSISNNTSQPKTTTITEEDQKAISQAISAYLTQQNSPLAKDEVITVDKRDGDYARAELKSTDADNAIAFVHYKESEWQVISVGTSFDFNFYLHHGIPQDIWAKTK